MARKILVIKKGRTLVSLGGMGCTLQLPAKFLPSRRKRQCFKYLFRRRICNSVCRCQGTGIGVSCWIGFGKKKTVALVNRHSEDRLSTAVIKNMAKNRKRIWEQLKEPINETMMWCIKRIRHSDAEGAPVALHAVLVTGFDFHRV